ncbi:MAG TPA: hypothetical protein PLP17_08960, partial [Oligoflexia bacterium]|nr:hypothetical protein [Oligoflexia bacterium]
SLKELQRKPGSAGPYLPTQSAFLERQDAYNPISLADTYRIIWTGFYPAIWVIDHGKRAMSRAEFTVLGPAPGLATNQAQVMALTRNPEPTALN